MGSIRNIAITDKTFGPRLGGKENVSCFDFDFPAAVVRGACPFWGGLNINYPKRGLEILVFTMVFVPNLFLLGVFKGGHIANLGL